MGHFVLALLTIFFFKWINNFFPISNYFLFSNLYRIYFPLELESLLIMLMKIWLRTKKHTWTTLRMTREVEEQFFYFKRTILSFLNNKYVEDIEGTRVKKTFYIYIFYIFLELRVMRKHSMKEIEGCWKGSKKKIFWKQTRGVKKC